MVTVQRMSYTRWNTSICQPVNQQPHMQTAAKIAEYVVYTNYQPHLLNDDVFPVDMNILTLKFLPRLKMMMVKMR